MNYSKFGAVKTEVDNIKFASKKEANRYLELKLLLKAGEITDLKLQERFPIKINDTLICTYVADFSYNQDGKRIVEDVKSAYTKKLPLYRIKKKLVSAVYDIEITET
jgi:hypothetical protein